MTVNDQEIFEKIREILVEGLELLKSRLLVQNEFKTKSTDAERIPGTNIFLRKLVQAHSPVYRCFRALWRGKVAALAFVSVSHPGMWYKACFCHVSVPVSALH